jgi:hypothetical protein
MNNIKYKDYLITDENNITLDDIINNNQIIINELKKYFYDKNTIKIIGKGETAQYINDAIGINQAVIFTNFNFIFFNDFENIFGIEKYLSKIKYAFFPDYPHVNAKSNKNYNYNNVINYLKKCNFNGKIFIYQIQTSLSNYALKNFSFKSCSSTDIPIQLFNKFLNIKNFELYGVNKGNLYHEDLFNLDFAETLNDSDVSKLCNDYIVLFKKMKKKKSTIYSDAHINNFKTIYNDLEKKLKINIIFN